MNILPGNKLNIIAGTSFLILGAFGAYRWPHLGIGSALAALAAVHFFSHRESIRLENRYKEYAKLEDDMKAKYVDPAVRRANQLELGSRRAG